MNKKVACIRKEVWRRFKNVQNIFFATSEGKRPCVRPVTMVHFANKFWVATGSNDAKVKQIKNNKNIEFCLMFYKGKNTGYIRGSGVANIVRDKKTKKRLANNIPYFKNYWKDAADPNFALLNIVIRNIEYLKLGAYKVEKFSLDK